ncbi:MAG: hypothetical protein ACTSWY_04095 [Promethearchaeota archaeon]
MADFGWISENGVERLNFFRKTNEILKYIHDIQKYIDDSTEIQLLEDASALITELVTRRMNSSK